MKKQALYIFFASLVLVLSGCGSNDKLDSQYSTSANKSVTLSTNPEVNGKDFNLSVTFTKNLSSDYALALKDFRLLSVGGCEVQSVDLPDSFEMRGGKGSTRSVLFSGTFKDECKPTGYKIEFTQELHKGDRKPKIETIEYDTEGSGTGGGTASPANGFYNATTPMQITQANYGYKIKVQVLEDAYAASNKEVKLKAFESKYGNIANPIATTGNDGYAVFNYTSPMVLPANGTSTTIKLSHDNNGTKIYQDIVLEFSPSSGGSASAYTLVNNGSITINYPSQSKEIAVQLTKNGVPQAGETVVAKSIPAAYGSIANASVTTGTDGYARFTYIAPDTLTAGTQPLELVYTDSNGVEISAASTITITPLAQPFEYNLTNVTDDLNITRDSQTAVISAYLVDSQTGVGVAGKTVMISTIANGYGSVTSATTTTDASGKAEFSYQAPADITPVDGTSTTVTVSFEENGSTISKAVAIEINEVSVSSDYTLANENNITINYPSQSKEIAVQLTKNGVPRAGETVVAKSIPAAYGSITNASVTTGTDGYARFTYIAPDTLTAGTQSLELVYTDSNGVEISAASTITIDPRPEYALINPTHATISYGSQKQDIKIQLTQRGVPVAGKQIQMLAFPDGNGTIVNGFTQTTDSSGYATYLYMAPDSLNEVNGTTIALTVQFDEGGVHLEENATLRFELAPPPSEPDKPIVRLDTENVTIDENSQTVGNLIVKVYKNNTPYDAGEVVIKVPSEGLGGTDIGYFNKYRAAVNASGIAEFTYTGPGNVLNTIAALDENKTTFTFYHSEADSNDTKLTVTFEPPADPIIYRNYYAEVLAAGGFHMYPEEQKTFTVALRATDTSGNDVALDDENITNIRICSENMAVAKIIDKDTNETVQCVDLNDTKSFNLRSSQLSGLVPVRVKIEFKDANVEEKNVTKTVNVRVYSGLPSAISISYVSTGQDVDRAKYIETFAVSVTDEYGNKVDTQPRITLGAIAGYAVDGGEVDGNETNETKRLYHGRHDIVNNVADGVLDINTSEVNTTTFSDSINSDVFKYVNMEGNNSDKLVIFGERKEYEAMGKWDIEQINNGELKLFDDYYGINRTRIWRGMYYAVGHNYYQDQCVDDGREWLGFTDSPSYRLDEEGTVLITYKYDYHLTGKDVLIWVNLTGYQPDTGRYTRFGEATKHTLRGAGLVAAPTGGFTLAKQSPPVLATFTIWHKNAPEHYRNAKFGYNVTSGSTCGATEVSSTNSYDARTCYNGGTGTTTITFQLTSLQDKDCTFNITNILPSNEF